MALNTPAKMQKKKRIVPLEVEETEIEKPLLPEGMTSDVEEELEEEQEESFFWQDPDALRILREVEQKRQEKLEKAKNADESDDEGIIIRHGSGATNILKTKKGSEFLQEELYENRVRTRCNLTTNDRVFQGGKLGAHIKTEERNLKLVQKANSHKARKQRKKDRVKINRVQMWRM